MSSPQVPTNKGAESAPASNASHLRRRSSWASQLLGVQGPLIGLVLLCLVFAFSTGNTFLSIRNGLNVLDQITVLGILSIGMTAVIVIGGIDLSVGSILALSMMVMGWLSHNYNVPLPIAMVAAVLIGALCGLGNGLLVTKAKLPPFIATLSMMTIARGLANIITDGQQIVGYAEWFD
jgi:ribose transport system permease protein